MADQGEVQKVALFGEEINRLEAAMEQATKTHAVIAHNIANANTPGYEALKFDEVLNQAVKRIEKPQVNLEEELAALSENGLRYSTYTKLLSTKFNVLRTIATQGRK
jgi:flagellar basal body rod protein FlgB